MLMHLLLATAGGVKQEGETESENNGEMASSEDLPRPAASLLNVS